MGFQSKQDHGTTRKKRRKGSKVKGNHFPGKGFQSDKSC